MDYSFCKCEIKKELINYYDIIKSEIDIKSQLLLIEYSMGIYSSITNKDKLVSINMKLIEIANDLFGKNMNQINDFFYSCLNNSENSKIKNKDDIKSKALKNYCVFVRNENLREEFKTKYPLGLILLLDWYLTEKQTEFVKAQFSYETRNIQIELDKNMLYVVYPFRYSNRRLVIKHEMYFVLFKREVIDELEKMVVLDLSFSSITYIRPFTFVNLHFLKELDISFNDISVIEENSFNGLHKLNKLSLASCKIKSIYPYAFRCLENLKILNLFDNNLEILRANLFYGLINLEELSLIYCNIRQIETKTFKCLERLKTLYLADNKLQILNEDMFENLTSLETLYLSSCQIIQIDRYTFKNLCNLKHLDLSNNSLESIKNNVFDGLKNLLELKLEDCKISYIESNAFECLKSLKLVNMARNPIDQEIEDKSKFEKLDLLGKCT